VQTQALDDALSILVRAGTNRRSLERFIAERYALTYGARIEHFADQLVGLTDAEGRWTAAVGYTPAQSAPLFIEQYLDMPIEQAIAERLGVDVDRAQVVEVGNLAATFAGAARRLVVAMTELLHRRGHTWVAFTSTTSLLNTFARLDIATIVLAEADPERLHTGAASWGSYYDTRPLVMAGNIPIGVIRFRTQRGHATRA
jgi:hypothetical protein